jgi:hypothetical protein
MASTLALFSPSHSASHQMSTQTNGHPGTRVGITIHFKHIATVRPYATRIPQRQENLERSISQANSGPREGVVQLPRQAVARGLLIQKFSGGKQRTTTLETPTNPIISLISQYQGWHGKDYLRHRRERWQRRIPCDRMSEERERWLFLSPPR